MHLQKVQNRKLGALKGIGVVLGIFAALFGVVGLIMFLPVLVEFFATGLVPRFPTLIVSTVLFVCALLLLVCGFVLDTVAKKHRQLFEINLNILRMLQKKEEQ